MEMNKISNIKMVNIIKDRSDTLRDKPNKTMKMLLFDEQIRKKHRWCAHNATLEDMGKKQRVHNEIAESFSKYALGK